jgi:hypothetical protein
MFDCARLFRALGAVCNSAASLDMGAERFARGFGGRCCESVSRDIAS